MEQSTVLKTFLDYVQISSESRSEKTFAKRVENDLLQPWTTSSNQIMQLKSLC